MICTVVIVQQVKFAHPIHGGVLRLAAAHVEGDNGDAHALCGLAVDVAQLQPRVVLLLPRPQRLLGYKWRIWKCYVSQITDTTFGYLQGQNAKLDPCMN